MGIQDHILVNVSVMLSNDVEATSFFVRYRQPVSRKLHRFPLVAKPDSELDSTHTCLNVYTPGPQPWVQGSSVWKYTLQGPVTENQTDT